MTVSPAKPGFREIKNRLPELKDQFITEHLEALPDLYFQEFSVDTICLHVLHLSRLAKKTPVHILFHTLPEGIIEFTVLGFDYSAVFSLITGVLSSYGFRFITGDIFTYRRTQHAPAPRTGRRRRVASHIVLHEPFTRRKIIDRFRGRIDSDRPLDIWIKEVEYQLGIILSSVETNLGEGVAAAKQKVNEMVASSLNKLNLPTTKFLFPVHLEINNSDAEYTRLHIVSEDTPFFLYTLSSALSLHNISIELVRIHTNQTRIEDDFFLSDLKGKKITDDSSLNKVKLSVLLTKQFTFFLGNSPDPYNALYRFESIVSDIVKFPEKGKWYDLLTNHTILNELAHLLGASDFLWEDFIRNQYETLLPMLSTQVTGRRFSKRPSTLASRINTALKPVKSLEEKKIILNRFKDREIYLIDLENILNSHATIKSLSLKLTRLAEEVIKKAFSINYGELVKKFGRPKSVAGLDANYALFGLGKFGGRALGYASDIELLFVYTDNGTTDGKHPITNAEFFEQLMKNSVLFIQAKREGIFQVDTRLRPFGKAGPLACSLENFCRYYGTGGKAHSSERLALVRMRAVGGHTETGALVERLRDEMIYESNVIDPAEVFSLREKQFANAGPSEDFNVKLGPGGLVDIEYSVQLLQVIHGSTLKALRTPLLHNALRELAQAKVLDPEQAERLTRAYYFFRKLINGLRMLRGSARDLLLPSPSSSELMHLARRIGYEYNQELAPQQQLLYDFETCSARVRLFVEQYFGREHLPSNEVGNIADIILSRQISSAFTERVLSKIGFKQTERAFTNLINLAGSDKVRESFIGIAVLAGDMLCRKPDPDMALNNWERFVRETSSPLRHYRLLLSQPRRLDILLTLFSVSHFLSDTLIRYPVFFEWVTQPEQLHSVRTLQALKTELSALSKAQLSEDGWKIELRRFGKREILRIAIRDICLEKPLAEIILELSRLAQVIINTALTRIWTARGKSERSLREHFCVMAFGKLGGNELNYSSDIDLLAFFDDSAAIPANAVQTFSAVFEALIQVLDQHTSEGNVYRVDLRLRPFGKSGSLVPSLGGLVDYYRQKAALWEIQALLKIRPVAGNTRLGENLLQRIKPLLTAKTSMGDIIASINNLRQKTVARLSSRQLSRINVKIGLGGIRDIEFLIQGLQRIHAAANPDILNGNTLLSLELLYQAGIISLEKSEHLKRDYIFLRRIEHYLQILEDRQTYELPEQETEKQALAKRVLGERADVKDFDRALGACLSRVREEYTQFIGQTHHTPSQPMVNEK